MVPAYKRLGIDELNAGGEQDAGVFRASQKWLKFSFRYLALLKNCSV